MAKKSGENKLGRVNTGAAIHGLLEERDEAREFARSLLAKDRILRCAFCDHEYPPGTPPTQHEALTAHVMECAKHPLRADRDRLAADAEKWRGLHAEAHRELHARCTELADTIADRDRLAERVRDLERIADENYTELADDMDESWGYAPGRRLEVDWPELHAMIYSRVVHKPAKSLRERVRELEQERDELRDEADMYAEHAIGCPRKFETLTEPPKRCQCGLDEARVRWARKTEKGPT